MNISLLQAIRKNGIYSAIIFIVILIAINLSLFFYNRNLMLRSQEVKAEVQQVEQRFDYLWICVVNCDLGIRGYMLTKDEHFLAPFNETMTNYGPEFAKLDEMLIQQGFDVSKLTDYKKGYRYKIDETLQIKKLQEEDQTEAALAIMKQDFGTQLWMAYRDCKKQIYDFEDQLKQQAEQDYRDSLRNTLVFQIMLCLLSLPALVMIFYRLRQFEKQRRKLFATLDQSNRQYLFHEGKEDKDERDESQIISHLINNLGKSTGFIRDITHGNYEVQWPGLDAGNQHLNVENLAGKLVRMRDQMKKVKAEDAKRIWANEGFTRFTELLRMQHTSLSEVLDAYLSELIKYLHATQGALFLANEEAGHTILELSTCYAYGRKKHLGKQIQPGQGLAGQAFSEKNVILLTEVPDSYIQITSGLGDTSPRCVLVVPAMYNEKVVGVLELASFRVFEEHEIQFVKKGLESLAATIVSEQINERTQQLLAESQQQSERMQAQEEELRQNAEEMQATQEAMNRRIQELEAMVQAQDKLPAI